jgi:hypothetical protein
MSITTPAAELQRNLLNIEMVRKRLREDAAIPLALTSASRQRWNQAGLPSSRAPCASLCARTCALSRGACAACGRNSNEPSSGTAKPSAPPGGAADRQRARAVWRAWAIRGNPRAARPIEGARRAADLAQDIASDALDPEDLAPAVDALAGALLDLCDAIEHALAAESAR